MRTLGNGAAQDRVRADFEKGVLVLIQQPLDGLGEANGLPDVSPPVFGVELGAGGDLSGDRRIERQSGRPRTDVLERFQQGRTRRLHLAL